MTEQEYMHDSLKNRVKQLKDMKKDEEPPFKYINSKMPKDTIDKVNWVREEIYSLWLTCQLNPKGGENLGQRFENKRKFK